MASKNKTENIKLNQWVETDRIQMEDFNSDNKKIDDFSIQVLKTIAENKDAIESKIQETNKKIPTKTSGLVNDSGFITSNEVDFTGIEEKIEQLDKDKASKKYVDDKVVSIPNHFHDMPQNKITESMKPLDFGYGTTLCSQSVVTSFPTINDQGVSLTFKGTKNNYAQIFITTNGDIWSRRSSVVDKWSDWYSSKKNIDKKANKDEIPTNLNDLTVNADGKTPAGTVVEELQKSKADKDNVVFRVNGKKGNVTLSSNDIHSDYKSTTVELVIMTMDLAVEELKQYKADKTYVDKELGDVRDNILTHNTAIQGLNSKYDKLFQSGVESNKILVDALNSKKVAASTKDTIKTNVNKVNDIELGAQIPLKPVTNLTGVGTGRESVKLTWSSPADVIFQGETITKFGYDVLVRSHIGTPQSINAGTTLVKASRDEFKSIAFEDMDVDFERVYYYRVFSVSKNGLITSGNSVSVDVAKVTPIKDLPVGAKIKDVNSKYYGKPIVWMKLEDNHYGMNETTLLSEQIICLKAYDAKEPNNSNSDREKYGNNRYIHSNIRQWLNSSASNWYSAQHSADAPPTSSGVSYNAYDKEKGFMANLTPELRSAILPTSLKVTKNPVDGGGLESFTDKIFIPSCTEVGLSNDTSYDEGTKFDYFKSDSDRVATTTKECVENSDDTNSGLNPNDTWRWWTRTPDSSSSNPKYVRIVYIDGSRNYYSAYDGGRGVRPALNLDSNTVVRPTPDSDGAYVLNL